MYNEIYEIIQGAIYGPDAVLDTYQNFVLTQLSTWMAYAVLLIPVIAVIAIVVKLLKW